MSRLVQLERENAGHQPKSRINLGEPWLVTGEPVRQPLKQPITLVQHHFLIHSSLRLYMGACCSRPATNTEPEVITKQDYLKMVKVAVIFYST